MKIGFINTVSVLRKVLTIKDYISKHNIDILYKKWFRNKEDEVTIGTIIPEVVGL